MSFRVFSVVFVLAAVLLPSQSPAIINGVLDTTNDCVGAIHGPTGSGGVLCSGTLIDESWVLAAAHCAETFRPAVFMMGLDWTSSTRVYIIDYIALHPLYSGPGSYDFALLHLEAPVPEEPVCAAQTPGEDTLMPGSVVTHVGFGPSDVPGGLMTQRHRTENIVDAVDAVSIFTYTTTSGPCEGDTGGPALTMPDQKVVGIISATDPFCSVWALDSRVSPVYSTFILPTIQNFSGIFFDGFERGLQGRWSTWEP